MRNLMLGGLCALGLGLPGRVEAAAPAHNGARTTTVRPGEDCQAIVRRVYGKAPGAMARFHTANPQLGGLPHVLQAGDTVTVPALERRPPSGAAAAETAVTVRAAEPARLGHVGPAVLTRAPGEGWTEALPEQALSRRSRVKTREGGVEVRLAPDLRVQLGPGGELVLEATPLGRRPAAVELAAGTLSAALPRGASLLVRTGGGQVRLRGTGRVTVTGEAEGRLTRVAVYEGAAEARGRGAEVPLRPGGGAILIGGERPRPVPLLQAPAWQGGTLPVLVPALGSLAAGGPPPSGRLSLVFSGPTGARRHQVEVARDDRWNDVRARGDTSAGAFSAALPPGTYYARVSAVGDDGIPGPPGPARRVEVVALRSDATAVPLPAGQLPVLQGIGGATLAVPATGRPVDVDLPGGRRDCAGGCVLRLPPGRHLVGLRVGDARAEVQVLIAEAPRAEVAAAEVEPPELPVPLWTPGFPGRALHPRTRAYALFSLGAALPGRHLDTYRLDLGGEVAFLRRRLSIDAALPVLYHDSGLGGGLAVGDLSLGFRAVPLVARDGRLSLGPLLRLQLPTGSFERPTEPGTRPVVIDTAVGGAAIIGRLGLLTTQGLTAVVNLQTARLRWSMTYAAEVRFWRLSIGASLDAGLGMVEGSSSGVAVGGGARLRLGRFRVLGFARGGLGPGGEELFGRYLTGLGLEWVR